MTSGSDRLGRPGEVFGRARECVVLQMELTEVAPAVVEFAYSVGAELLTATPEVLPDLIPRFQIDRVPSQAIAETLGYAAA